jgi:hypothetical protein
MCVFRIDVFYINAIEPDNERNNVFSHYSPFFCFASSNMDKSCDEVYVHYAKQSQFEVCVMLQNYKMFCNLNVLYCLLCCSMKMIVDDGCTMH